MSTARLLLVRHATTAETRRAAFPSTTGAGPVDGCPPLDRAGTRAAEALEPHLPAPDRGWSSHACRALQTAALAGVEVVADSDLAEGDWGRWAGLTPTEVHATEPETLAGWYADLESAPHGGEPLSSVRARARRILDRAEGAGGTTIAFTHGGLVGAALLEALDLPAAALWRLEASPASVTELHPGGTGWRLVRLNWTPAFGASGRAAVA